MIFRFPLIAALFTTLPQLGFTQKHWSQILDKEPAHIDQLPTEAKAQNGKLSLWADFSIVKDESITVYLINKTEDAVSVSTQDGNPYIKIEGQHPDTEWVRAEPHVYSWCGNSYFNTPKLPKDHFLRVSAWYPKEGIESKIRYRIYGELNLTSNEGLGKIRPESIQAAKHDAMAIRFGDIALIRTVILEKKDIDNEWPDLTNMAIRRLDDFPPKQTTLILEAILDDNSYGARALDDAIRIYAKHAPIKACNYLIDKLKTGDTAAQKRILRMHDLHLAKDVRYLSFLQLHYEDPESALRFDAMRALIRLEGEDAKMPLLGILKSTEDERTRRYIQMLWERKFGKHSGIRIKAKHQGSYEGNSVDTPILIEITLTNKSKLEYSFQYQYPKEIIDFWVTSDNHPIPLKSLHTLPPSTEHSETARTIHLSYGDSHKLMVDLRDFFDPADLADKHITYYVRCRLPGIHEAYFVDSTGYSIRID